MSSVEVIDESVQRHNNLKTRLRERTSRISRILPNGTESAVVEVGVEFNNGRPIGADSSPEKCSTTDSSPPVAASSVEETSGHVRAENHSKRFKSSSTSTTTNTLRTTSTTIASSKSSHSVNCLNLEANFSSTTTDDESYDLETLLAQPSTKELEISKNAREIVELLNQPTVQEQRTTEKFRTDGTQLKEFCPHGTRENCRHVLKQQNKSRHSCAKLHFRKIIQKHTDESLGDCSFLNTCFHMNTCKYIHYEIVHRHHHHHESSSSKSASGGRTRRPSGESSSTVERDIGGQTNNVLDPPTKLFPPQWIQCDLRFFDLTVLGKFSVVMADPPWDIHMELPYGTMSDDEMRHLNVQCLQDEGLMFLWVTGRAMELGRECLKLWGYQQCDEIIWVKTNQLQRIIRTGRTGHWLNHGKEHCLVGIKGSVDKYNRGLDCDVIVAEVRATSHKPDEVYGVIERLSPGTRKVELFGRQHNVQHNWITLGNQLDGVRLLDLDVVSRFRERYPDGNCMPKPEEVLLYKQKQQQQQQNSSCGVIMRCM